MRQPEKYVELAEGCLDNAREAAEGGGAIGFEVAAQHCQRAQVYATLALAAATRMQTHTPEGTRISGR